jgi:hypothetical protein
VNRDQAESLIHASLGQGWSGGTFMIASVREDADYFGFTYGNREWIVDEDPAYELVGGWPVFVNKAMGQMETPSIVTSWWSANEYFDQMPILVDNTF